MRFVRAFGLTGLTFLLALSAVSCKKNKLTFDLDATAPVVDAAPPPEDAAPPPDLDAGAEAAAPLTAPTTSATQPKGEGPFFGGETWNGSYICHGPSTLALHIVSAAGNHIVGIFNFVAPGNKSGSFNTSGIYDPISRHLIMSAGTWIKNPGGFVTVNLDGFVSPDHHSYNGHVQGPGCASFSVHH